LNIFKKPLLSNRIKCLCINNQVSRLSYLEALHLNPLETKILLFPDNLEGQTIVLETEQGIGDELFFLRFALILKQRGAKIGYFLKKIRNPIFGKNRIS
jgi:hypothetical protein